MVLLALSMLATAMLSACGSEETPTTAPAGETTTTAPAPETTAPAPETTAPASTETTAPSGGFEGEVVIGALNSMTGVNAMGGAEQKWAQEQAVADINAKGGINVGGKQMELKIKFMDDRSESAQAVAGMEKLIKVEGVNLIVSSNNSAYSTAAAPVAEKYGAYFSVTNCWVDWIADGNYQWVGVVSTTPEQVAALPFAGLDLQPEGERPTRIGILTQDNADGQALGQSAVDAGKAAGYDVVEYQAIVPGTKDFSSVILKFKASEADVVFGLCAPVDAITFMKQVKEQNFSPKFIGGWMGFWPAEFWEALGPDAQYVIHDGFWSESGPNPGSAELGQKFRAAHDGRDSVSIGYPYANVQLLAMAIERAGSTDPAAVRDVIWGGTFEGTTMGDITVDERGVGLVNYIILQWIDGDRIPIYPPSDNPELRLQWFVPWGER